jgi:hypothetical protein
VTPAFSVPPPTHTSMTTNRRGFLTGLILAFLAPLARLFRPKLVIVPDEFASLSNEIYEVAKRNAFSGAPCQFVCFGNPDSYYDTAGEFTKPMDGWESIKEDTEGWETEMGYCVRFDGSKKPNNLL